MDMLILTSFIMFLMGYFLFNTKKLITLLMLEGLMLSSIMMYASHSNSYNLSYFFLIIMTLMMVMDSVFSISMLVFVTRNSSMFSCSNKYI